MRRCWAPCPTRSASAAAPRPTSSCRAGREWATKLNDLASLARRGAEPQRGVGPATNTPSRRSRPGRRRRLHARSSGSAGCGGRRHEPTPHLAGVRRTTSRYLRDHGYRRDAMPPPPPRGPRRAPQAGRGLSEMAPLPDPDDPRLWYVLYDDAGATSRRRRWRLVGRGPEQPGAELRSSPPTRSITGPAARPTIGAHIAARRLIEHSSESPAAGLRGRPEAADPRLAKSPTQRTSGDPIGELERLTRETLGLLTHRLDAWHASLAAERLAQQRKLTPDRRPGRCLRLGRQPRARRRRRPTPRASSTHPPWPTPPPQPCCAARGARSRPTPAPPRSRSTSPPSACAAPSGSSRGVRNGQELGELLGAASSGGSTTRCSTAISRTCARRC